MMYLSETSLTCKLAVKKTVKDTEDFIELTSTTNNYVSKVVRDVICTCKYGNKVRMKETQEFKG